MDGKKSATREPTPYERMTDLARKVVRVPKEEVERRKPKKSPLKTGHR